MKKLIYSFPAKFAAVLLYAVSVFAACCFGGVIVSSFVLDLYSFPPGMIYGEAVETLTLSGAWNPEGLSPYYEVLQMVYDLRWWSVAFATLLALFALSLFVFIICAAGRRDNVDGNLTFFDRIPLDLTALFSVGFAAFVIELAIEFVRYPYFNDGVEEAVLTALILSAAVTLLALTLLFFCRTFSARVRAGRWWRNSVICYVLRLCWRFLKWSWKRIRTVGGWFLRLGRAIPFGWRAALLTVGVLLVNIFLTLATFNGGLEGFGVLLLLGLDLAVLAAVVLGSYQMTQLREAGEKLAAGDLSYKTDTRNMFWDFKKHGDDLNSIALGLSAAVEERMRSERLKTELITNVSHDIKTPLTNIVNSVDLLKKTDDPAERAEYLDVLARQAERLKKLTVDLVEASKASTGAISVDPVPTNVAEIISQSLAEYGEKLSLAGLTPVVTLPEEPVTVLADGRHLWRVLDNLLGNAVKYAQPGTRLYVDVTASAREAVISVKNVSRDRLNISPDELMERFVRGDASRHTEGSGLGLSIARSLTELMGGTFDIGIDGDLFKARVCLVTSYTGPEGVT